MLSDFYFRDPSWSVQPHATETKSALEFAHQPAYTQTSAKAVLCPLESQERLSDGLRQRFLEDNSCTQSGGRILWLYVRPGPTQAALNNAVCYFKAHGWNKCLRKRI